MGRRYKRYIIILVFRKLCCMLTEIKQTSVAQLQDNARIKIFSRRSENINTNVSWGKKSHESLGYI